MLSFVLLPGKVRQDVKRRSVFMKLFRSWLCAVLVLAMVLGAAPLTALAAEENGVYTGEPPKVESVSPEGMIMGKTRSVLRFARNGAFPNNPPADVDTVEEKVDWIVEQCKKTGLTDEWEIALWLHDWLIYNANYDYTFSYYYPDGVLLNGTGVCMSYALAYGLLLDEFEIENTFLAADGMNHAWNLVKLNDEWCHVDCTWDDPNTGGYENHTYFGMTDKMIMADHYGWVLSDYPACTSKINYYPIGMGYNVCENEAEFEAIMAKEAAAQNPEFDIYYIGGESDFSMAMLFKNWYDTYKRRFGLETWGYIDYGSRITISLYYAENLCKTREEVRATLDREAAAKNMEFSLFYIGEDVDFAPITLFWSWINANDDQYEITWYGYYDGGYQLYVWLNYEDVPEDHVHHYVDEVTAPSCTEGGSTISRCSCGGYYVGDETDALGHSFIDYVPNGNATCTEDGTKTAKCVRCDVTDEIADTGSATGHAFGEWTVTAEPGCTEKGEKQRVCSGCGQKETEEVAALGHAYESVVTKPTCTEQGFTTHTCTNCGDSYVGDEVEPLGHNMAAGEIVKAATCTESGEMKKECSCCDYAETEVIPATGHDYNAVVTKPTCTEGGFTTCTCTNCGDSYIGDEMEPLGHNFEDGTCTNCGEKEVTRIPGDIDGNGNVDVDDVLALLWYVLFPGEYPIEAEADFDGNGATDVDDVLTLLWHVLFPEEYPLV